MKIEDVIKLLTLRLPMATDLFTDVLNADSIIYNNLNSQLTITTSADHLLETNDLVNLVSVVEPIPITDLVYNADTCSAIATTEFPHDIQISIDSPRYLQPIVNQGLYKPVIYKEDKIVSISGADQVEYNGDKVLINVIDEFNFEYLIIGDQPTVTPATGVTIFDKKDNLFNGLFSIEVVTSDTFIVDIVPTGVDNPIPPVEPLINFDVHMRHRISGGINLDRVIASYTKQKNTKLWLFVTLEGVAGSSTFASQRRQTRVDAVDVSHRGNQYLQSLIENLSVFIFSSTIASISARKQRDVIEDVKVNLFNSMLGVVLPSNTYQTPFGALVYNNDEVVEYNTAFYIHRFNFERTINIEGFDLAQSLYPVSLSQIDVNYLKEDSAKDIVIMTDKIKLGK